MGSPAIGAGVTLAAVTDDFLGAPRPSAGDDIGAFQYGSTPDGGGAVGPLGDAAPSLEGGDGATEPQEAFDAGAGAAPASGGEAGAEGGSVEATSPNAKSAGCSCSAGTSASPGRAPSAFVPIGIALTLLRRPRLRARRRRRPRRSTCSPRRRSPL